LSARYLGYLLTEFVHTVITNGHWSKEKQILGSKGQRSRSRLGQICPRKLFWLC